MPLQMPEPLTRYFEHDGTARFPDAYLQWRFVEVEIAAALGPTLQAKEVPSTGTVRAARLPEAHVRRVVWSYCSSVAVQAALRTCGKLSNLRRTVTIALVVGCILSIINEGI